jgi:subtilisin family serine protease
MKFFNVALALALVLAPDTAFATNESNIFNVEPTFPHQDGLEETASTASSKGIRGMVKYNDNSPKFKTRLETARIQAQANEQGDSAVPSFSPDTHLLTHGRFLPNQNVEIMYFNSEEEMTLFGQSKEVEYIEEDSLFYMNAEQIPYGIDTVEALAVSDDNVSNRKVCILDTGYDITHPDLTSDTAIVTGYTGSNSAGPRPWTYDGHGHGTHVAGTIAAIGSNNKGVVGVNRNGQLKLHIVKVFGDTGTCAGNLH